MKTTSTTFDNSMPQWIKEQNQPWGRLKYKMAQANLAKHLSEGPLQILDAGGGNGYDSIPMALQGHHVDIVDYSTEMLALARAQAAETNTTERIATHQAELGDIRSLFEAGRFDLVLCHNVVSYVDDVLALFRDLTALLKAGGLVSIIGLNRYSIPYHAAFLKGDLEDARARIDAREFRANIFDATVTCYSADEISALLRDAGCRIEHDYGIRCICDYWGDNERKADPQVFAQIEALEFALADKHPYKLLARFFHIIARKTDILRNT